MNLSICLFSGSGEGLEEKVYRIYGEQRTVIQRETGLPLFGG